MKKINLVLLLTFFTTFTVECQIYNSILFGKTRWHYIDVSLGAGSKSYCYFSNDTTGYYYQGKKYWKLEKMNALVYTPTPGGLYIFDDTFTRRVYHINPSTNVEYLLYDFSADAGDTINSIGVNVIETVKVDSVKYETVSGVTRKVMHVSTISGYPSIWVEGVGCVTQDFFVPGSFFPDMGSSFKCLSYDSNFIYGDSINCNSFQTSITQIPIKESNISIANNQNSHFLTVTNPNNLVFSLHLLDLNGRKIYDQKVNYSSLSIDLSNYQNTLLVYRIITENNKRIVGKVSVY